MLFAKRRTSRFSQETSAGGYSKPAPGLDILDLFVLLLGERGEKRKVVSGMKDSCSEVLCGNQKVNG